MYATIAKCKSHRSVFTYHSAFIGMNVLSGSTWKGAKLRIGEAKPDFCERYAPRALHFFQYSRLRTVGFCLKTRRRLRKVTSAAHGNADD